MSIEDHIFSFSSITQKAALACLPLIGKGDRLGADKRAVEAMREAFNKLSMDIKIVIGEGERDKAPMLYAGERLGDRSSPLKWDVAVDPLEGTNICAVAGPGALSVLALAPRGQLFKAPDIYMDKIACGPLAKDLIDLKAGPKQNVALLSKALHKAPEDIIVGVLNRPRHEELIRQIRETKARIKLVDDGDVALAVETARPSGSVDLLLGTGGSPEGVLSACALKCLGGGFQGRLLYKNEEERQRAKSAGVTDLDKIWTERELAGGDVLFVATGVTAGSLLEGVQKEPKGSYLTETLILTLTKRYRLKAETIDPYS